MLSGSFRKLGLSLLSSSVVRWTSGNQASLRIHRHQWNWRSFVKGRLKEDSSRCASAYYTHQKWAQIFLTIFYSKIWTWSLKIVFCLHFQVSVWRWSVFIDCLKNESISRISIIFTQKTIGKIFDISSIDLFFISICSGAQYKNDPGDVPNLKGSSAIGQIGRFYRSSSSSLLQATFAHLQHFQEQKL